MVQNNLLYVATANLVHTHIRQIRHNIRIYVQTAFVYMVQNNLLYVATANLDAATCQVIYVYGIRLFYVYVHMSYTSYTLYTSYTRRVYVYDVYDVYFTRRMSYDICTYT